MPKPEVWVTPNGRVYDIAHAARLIGTTAAKLRAMIHGRELVDPGEAREAVAEADVLRLRAERGRLQAELDRRSKPEAKRPRLIDGGRTETRLRERPADQAALNWSRFPEGGGPARE